METSKTTGATTRRTSERIRRHEPGETYLVEAAICATCHRPLEALDEEIQRAAGLHNPDEGALCVCDHCEQEASPLPVYLVKWEDHDHEDGAFGWTERTETVEPHGWLDEDGRWHRERPVDVLRRRARRAEWAAVRNEALEADQRRWRARFGLKYPTSAEEVCQSRVAKHRARLRETVAKLTGALLAEVSR